MLATIQFLESIGLTNRDKDILSEYGPEAIMCAVNYAKKKPQERGKFPYIKKMCEVHQAGKCKPCVMKNDPVFMNYDVSKNVGINAQSNQAYGQAPNHLNDDEYLDWILSDGIGYINRFGCDDKSGIRVDFFTTACAIKRHYLIQKLNDQKKKLKEEGYAVSGEIYDIPPLPTKKLKPAPRTKQEDADSGFESPEEFVNNYGAWLFGEKGLRFLRIHGANGIDYMPVIFRAAALNHHEALIKSGAINEKEATARDENQISFLDGKFAQQFGAFLPEMKQMVDEITLSMKGHHESDSIPPQS